MRSRLILGLALAAVAACNGDHVGTGGGGTRVLLTDAPFPFDQVSRVDVYIVRVEASANSDTTAPQDWTTLVEPNRTFNLLDVQGGATALLGETPVDAGQFAAIRMVIRTDLSGITLADGSPAGVSWLGSATQIINALVEQPLSITTGGSGNLIIDFDVGRSFVQIPGGGFQFLPWIRAVNQDATGSISGLVMGANGPGSDPAPVEKASIAVYRGGGSNALQLAATGVTDAQGRYTIHYISGGGPYVIEAAPPTNFQASPGYADGVMVTPGQETLADVTLNVGTGGGGQLKISGPSQVAVGQSITLSAFVFNANGDSVIGAPVTWSSSNPTAARLNGSGASVQLTGLAAGSTSIEAWSNELWDSVVVTVGDNSAPVASVQVVPDSLSLAVGDSVGLQAFPRDAIGNLLTGRTITWSFDSTLVHQLDSFGTYLIIRAAAAGTGLVTATVEGKQGSARVTVH
jgi:Domain of unknown function (DUF4382)/Bacterial Ig-like domain (group 2)